MTSLIEEMKFDSIITDIGFEKINSALITGEKLDLKYIAVGDSCGDFVAFSCATD